MSNFYGTEIKIWASFWPDCNIEKKTWVDYEQLSKSVLSCFQECIHTKEVHKKKLKNELEFFLKIW